MKSSVRVLPAAFAVMSLITACGSEEPGATGDTLRPPGDELLAPTPIRAVGGSAPGAGPNSATAETGSPDIATDLSMPFQLIEYVLGDVGELPTNTTGYLFPAGATVEASRVAAVAAALGVSGDVVAGSSELGTIWQVGPSDGSAPSLTVGSDAQLGWWYNAAWESEGRAVEACEVSADSDGTQTDDCVQQTPPGILAADEAEQRARDLLGAMGEDPAAFEYEVFADDWFASVSATKPIDGITSPLAWGFGFGENGVLQYASGSFAVPEAVGPYPLIGLDDAFARLQDQGSYWGGAPFLAETTVARVETAVVEPAVGGDEAVSSPVEPPPTIAVPSDDPTQVEGSVPVDIEDSIPVDVGEPIPEPEPIVVTLVGIEADVWWAWDEDGSVWLLPAYRFIGDDDGRYTVTAVTDEFLIVVEPDPVPVLEPLPVETPPTDSVPVEVPGSTQPGSPGDLDTVPDQTAPGEPGDGSGGTPEPFDTSVLESSVGASLSEFTLAAESLGATVRVTERDGESLIVTADYQPNRVNVAVEGDTVTDIKSVG
jgi:hypothetical protein